MPVFALITIGVIALASTGGENNLEEADNSNPKDVLVPSSEEADNSNPKDVLVPSSEEADNSNPKDVLVPSSEEADNSNPKDVLVPSSEEADNSNPKDVLVPSSEEADVNLKIDLTSLTYNSENIEVLKSGTFYNPWTKNKDIWIDEFEDHGAIRLWDIFGKPSRESLDKESFKLLLAENREIISELAPKHDKFIVTLEYTPVWLSSSNDETPKHGQLVVANTYGPSDYETWNEIISETVVFFSQFDVDMYYEVWNEPDIDYWEGGIDSYLELYEQTASTVKSTDPNAKVGGAVTSHWSNEMEPGRKSLNIELIEYAAQNEVPLDFIVWHHYSTNPGKILEAKLSFEKAIKENNYEKIPEYVVSEWNVFFSDIRKSPLASSIMAENLFGFYTSGVDIQTFSSWEDFNYYVDDYSGYGLITQQGEKKPQYYVHQVFDILSRGQGLNVIQDENLTTIISQSSEDASCYDFVMWNLIPHVEKEAVAYILTNVPIDELSKYEDEGEIIEHIWKGHSIDGKRDKEFAVANSIHNEQFMDELYKKNEDRLNSEMKVRIDLQNNVDADINFDLSIKESINRKEIVQNNGQISFNLENNEVFYMNLCVK